MTLIEGWGRYPRQEAQVLLPMSPGQCAQAVREATSASLIARGQGRAYGDSALAEQVLAMRQMDHFLSFDPAAGLLRCAAGLTLDTILQVCVPQGWFPPVTPGTRFVTVGGAITWTALSARMCASWISCWAMASASPLRQRRMRNCSMPLAAAWA